MLKIWDATEMTTAEARINRDGVIQYAEAATNKKIKQYGPAGKSRFNKALEILADLDFEVYRIIGNEKLN